MLSRKSLLLFNPATTSPPSYGWIPTPPPHLYITSLHRPYPAPNSERHFNHRLAHTPSPITCVKATSETGGLQHIIPAQTTVSRPTEQRAAGCRRPGKAPPVPQKDLEDTVLVQIALPESHHFLPVTCQGL
ncbi:unnamed protein product [Pleuronectes platessa]|uniref:Uncharacterized protein n=1 Tax=Pleuronectes platessa TaxID=8262 RepID=A0A9N7Y4Z8_PLEPL|nr:unnamed protein product [Pleuronectes platessa]